MGSMMSRRGLSYPLPLAKNLSLSSPSGFFVPTRTGAARFQTTQWSVVLKAGQGAEEALLRLCRNYWTPLYAFSRRRGNSAHEGEDLPQSFLAHVLEHRS